MRVQSIWTAIQIRNPTRNRFLRPPRQVPLREVHRVAKLHHVTQKIRPMAEALQNTRHFGAPGFRAPFVVDLSDIASRVRVFNQLDLRGILSHRGETICTTISRGILYAESIKRLTHRITRTSPCLRVIRSRSKSSSKGIACFRVSPVIDLNPATSIVLTRIAPSFALSSRSASA
jgi:hypothetical protein